MIRKFTANILAIAAALALAACASTAPVSSTDPSVAPTASTTTSETGQVPFITPRGFRVETRNGENYYCQRIAQTGSRAKASESCYTLAEITQMRETGQGFVNRMQTSPTEMPAIAPDANGGGYVAPVN